MKGTALVEFELWGRGDWPRREVVGESFHAEEIRSLFPAQMPEGGQELILPAALIPDPQNIHDHNAVRVSVQGCDVGHLSREDAAGFQPVLLALTSRGFLPVTRARIWAYEYDEWVGTDRRGRDVTRTSFKASVSLALDEWYLCVPVNQPPMEAHTTLPFGSAIQVRKEENHQDVLRRYVTRQGECWVYGTLHCVTEQTARTTKEVVEVRIDGHRVGDLTPAMSAEYLPAIRELAARGRATAVRMIVKGNQVKADVVLHALKAHQLPADWIAEHLTDGVSSAARQPEDPQLGAPQTTLTMTTTPEVAKSSYVPDPATSNPPTPARDRVVPPKPRVDFCTPPGWPTPPAGWEPQPGWLPGQDWPPAPVGWEFWQLTWNQ
ncbi:MAG: HIRAN domain-containing protein [Microlunatus sp.]|nr:HIRAN domain-containing protein [Microlunatus sp.]